MEAEGPATIGKCEARTGTPRPVGAETASAESQEVLEGDLFVEARHFVEGDAAQSAHRMEADLLPEEVILSEKVWGALIQVHQSTYRSCPEFDLEVVVQDALFGSGLTANGPKSAGVVPNSGGVARRAFEVAGAPDGCAASDGPHLDPRRLGRAWIICRTGGHAQERHS